MIRKHKQFSWPRQMFDRPRILEENKLVSKYGLKNKREIWKTEAKINYFRNRAKSLVGAEQEEMQLFFDNINKIGLKVNSVADVLALKKDDLLKRRLSSVMVDKNLATTPKQARQMIVHKKVMIKGRVVNSPSYLVKVDEEGLLTIKKKAKKPKAEKQEEAEQEVSEENQQETTQEEVKEETE